MKKELEEALDKVNLTYNNIVEIADSIVSDYTKELDNFIKHKTVFSRVDPIQKLEIINSYNK